MNDSVHLVLFRKALLPGGEWAFSAKHWTTIRLSQGRAYVRVGSTAAEIAEGGVLLVPPRSSVSVLASTLGRAEFCGVLLRTDALTGFLTIVERRWLESLAPKSFGPFQVLAADRPLAVRFAEFCHECPQPGFTVRLALIEAFARLIAPQAAGVPEPAESMEPQDVRRRLLQLMAQLPESELVNLGIGQLAARLNCCSRHASRIFHELFGCTHRTHVTKLRLKKACQLLLENKLKVIDVALESGHRSLAVFNYLFKKHYGVTPSEWRRQRHGGSAAARGRPRPACRPPLAMVVLLIFGFCGGSSGGLLGSAEDRAGDAPAAAVAAPAAPEPQIYTVRRYAVDGNTLLSVPVIEELLRPHTGERVDVEGIRKALMALQLAYRERGFPTVAVTLPEQAVTNGVIRFQVIEGKLAEIRVFENRHFSSNNVRRALPSLRTNTLLNARIFQAELDRANANPDRQIYPELRPGPDAGTSLLILQVKDRFPLHGRVEVNNYATPATPDLRVNTSLAYDNVAQREHSLGFQYGFTPQATKDTLTVPGLDLIRMDAPLVAYYSAYYRAPLRGAQRIGAEIEREPARFGYNEVTRQFSLPPSRGRTELSFFAARSTSGSPLVVSERTNVVDTPLLKIDREDAAHSVSADNLFGGRLVIPLTAARTFESTLTLGIDFKNHEAWVLATNTFFATAVITNETGQAVVTEDVIPIAGNRSLPVTYLPLFAGFTAARADRWGQTSAGFSALWNCVGDAFSPGEEFEAGVGSDEATGQFVVLRAQVAREQQLGKDWSLWLRAEGQWANEPLVSLEQYASGGISNVRGYLEGERYGDLGWLATWELRSPTIWFGRGERPRLGGLRFMAFTDYGESYLVDPGLRERALSLWGAGVGLAWTLGRHWEARAAAAWALQGIPARDAGDERFSFSVAGRF